MRRRRVGVIDHKRVVAVLWPVEPELPGFER